MKNIAALPLALTLLLPMGACSPKITGEDEKNGKVALCAMADSLTAQLKVGGATARAAAGIIKENTTDPSVRAAATAVQRGSKVTTNNKALRSYLAKKC